MLVVPKLVDLLLQILVNTLSCGLPKNFPLANPDCLSGEVGVLLRAKLLMELLKDRQLTFPENLKEKCVIISYKRFCML